MANHITNIVTFENVFEERLKQILTEIQNDEEGLGSIDFNKIIPMPEHIFRGNLGAEEFEKYGNDNWYSWSVDHWGTKTNGFYQSPYSEGENVIEFCTAWSEPQPILIALSQKYPDVQIHHQYADEDTGYNCGERYYKDGQVISENIPDGGSKAAYEMAADILGYDLEGMGYRLSEDGFNYEFVGDDPQSEPKEEIITVVLVKPMKSPIITQISNDPKTLQDTVGGHIEVISPYSDGCDLVCNETGKNDRLPLNRALRDEDGIIQDIIAGTFFICSARGENFSSLSDDEAKKYMEQYKNPEQFYKINGEIKAIPMKQSKSKDYER